MKFTMELILINGFKMALNFAKEADASTSLLDISVDFRATHEIN